MNWRSCKLLLLALATLAIGSPASGGSGLDSQFLLYEDTSYRVIISPFD